VIASGPQAAAGDSGREGIAAKEAQLRARQLQNWITFMARDFAHMTSLVRIPRLP